VSPQPQLGGGGDVVAAEEGTNVAPKGPASSVWPWPDALDASVATPSHHTLLFESARVRVRDTRIAPGEMVPVHTHRWSSVLHVLGWGDCVRRDVNDVVLVDTHAVGSISEPRTVLWSASPSPHSLANVGQSAIHVISVEPKDERA
jgi:predicted metal-dependent enzyme (double-stranded beta helix superfamily)